MFTEINHGEQYKIEGNRVLIFHGYGFAIEHGKKPAGEPEEYDVAISRLGSMITSSRTPAPELPKLQVNQVVSMYGKPYKIGRAPNDNYSLEEV